MTMPDQLVAVFAEDALLAPDPDDVLAAVRAGVAGRRVPSSRRVPAVLAAAAAVVVVGAAVGVWGSRDPHPAPEGLGGSAPAAQRPLFTYRTPTSPGQLIPVGLRQRAEALTLPTLAGGTVTLAAHRGDVVVLTWTASWCGPCRATRGGGVGAVTADGIESYAIATRDAPDNATRFFGRTGLTLDDPSGDSMTRFGALPGVLPTTVLVDRHQLVAAVYVTPVDTALVRSAAQRLAAEPAD